MNLENTTLTELKALAYDHIATIEAHQTQINDLRKNLSEINDKIGVMIKTMPEVEALKGVEESQPGEIVPVEQQ